MKKKKMERKKEEGGWDEAVISNLYYSVLQDGDHQLLSIVENAIGTPDRHLPGPG